MANNDYNINIFKPKTTYTKINSSIILITIVIWAAAVFGFQFLLKALEKPVPEKNYITFTENWKKIQDKKITIRETQDLLKTIINLSGKSAEARSNKTIDKFVTVMIYQILPENKKEDFINLTNDLESKNAENMKMDYVLQALNIQKNDITASLIPYNLINLNKAFTLKNEELEEIPVIMKKYLVHNRSFLTDTKFLGFPFHYFYTAVFLLILFVLLCFVYCKIIEKVNKNFNIEQEEI